MPVFPSVEWFQAVADVVNKDPEYRHLGTCDARVGMEVGEQVFIINFEAFEIAAITRTTLDHKEDLDFTLVLPPEQWEAMIRNIKAHGRAELDYTLNSIDLGTATEFARADDYYRRDLFYRFNQSFQHFFDASAKIETQFAEPARR